jgi:CHAT domain-containing protein/Tfp pilus assembly protein PilF
VNKKLNIFVLLILLLIFSSFSYTQEITSQINKAKKLYIEGKYKEALQYFNYILEKGNLDNENKIKLLIHISLTYWNLGKIKNSYDFICEANKLSKDISKNELINLTNNIKKIHEFYNEGKNYRKKNDYLKSKQSFENAIKLSKLIKIKEYLIKCYRQLSISEYDRGNFKDYFSLNKKALSLAKEINHKKEECRCLNNIGLYYWKIDNYSKALQCFEEALKISINEGYENETTKCLNNISIIYKDLGEFDKSLNYIFKSLEQDTKLNNLKGKAIDLNNIGVTFHSKAIISSAREDFLNAEKYYKECLNLAKKLNEKRLEIHVLNNLGAIYTLQEKYEKALNYFHLALSKTEEIQDIEDRGYILNNIGIVHYNLGNFEKSTKYYQKAIQLALGVQRGQILWEAYLELAKANWKQGNTKDALENYKKSIDIIENIRSQIELEEYKARYLGTDKRIEAYHNIINLFTYLNKKYPNNGYDKEAFNYLERAKARAFLDSIELSRLHLSKRLDIKLQNKEKELQKDISYLYTKLLAASLSPKEKERLQKELQNKEEELESIKREIRDKDPAYAGLQYPKIISLSETQKLLDKNSAFIAYCITKNNGLGFLITKKGMKIFSLPDREAIQDLVRKHLFEITDKNNEDYEFSRKLYSVLIPQDLNKKIKRLIIVPDDILHKLPFETLIQNNSQNWLIERYSISYAPSISSLREIIQRSKENIRKRNKDILALGDPYFHTLNNHNNNGDDIQQNFYSSIFNISPLKYSGVEIQKIQTLFKKKAKIYTKKEASEEIIKNKNLSDYKIIHFATHSLIDDKIPARSAIILSLDEDPNEDGFLQMREIYNLHLNADLVTLSACETGLGQFIRGEGIEGINRAFFYAGASAVLMSLWAVNDQATYQLMERFYYHLKNGVPLTDALRKAKLEMINSDVLNHPYYWAGFILSGRSNQIIFPRNKLRWVIVSLTCLLIGGVIALTIIKKNGHQKNNH